MAAEVSAKEGDKNFIIDSHVHVLPPRRLGGLMRWIKRGFPSHPLSENITRDDILGDLASQGVSHFFNFVYPLKEEETGPLNDFNKEFCAQTPGAIPFASLHPETPDKSGLAERLLAKGDFAGFKFHPFVQGFDPWDRRMDGLYGFLQEAGVPVVLHTGFEDFYKKPMPADELGKLLKRYPRLPAVFVHMAFPELEKVYGFMEDFPDLYLDATNVPACLRDEFRPLLKAVPGGDRIPDLLQKGLHRYQGRIMFGSDHPAGMGSLEDIYSDLKLIELEPSAREALQAGAARAFSDRFFPGHDWSNCLKSPPLNSL
ncbi:MAG: amidohydrolase family protein [bacterium]